MKVYETTNKAHLQMLFFAMLHGYVNTFSPSKAGMIAVKSILPADEYLELAQEYGDQANIAQAETILQQVKELVDQKQYEEAYNLIANTSLQLKMTDKESST